LFTGFPGRAGILSAPIRCLHPEGRQLGFGGGGGESFCVPKQICLLSKPPHPPQQAALLIFWPATISLRDASFQRNNVPANSSLSLVQETENTHTQTILDPLPLESNFTNLFGSFGFRQNSRELCII
jgi:hypothetical protein